METYNPFHLLLGPPNLYKLSATGNKSPSKITFAVIPDDAGVYENPETPEIPEPSYHKIEPVGPTNVPVGPVGPIGP